MDTTRRTLLIIEDNKELQNIYSSIFNQTDWQIIGQAYDGPEAKELYRSFEEKPEVVICDIELPSCSGLEVASEILQFHPNQKILFVTARILHLENQIGFKNIPRVAKPFNMDDILEELAKLILV
ncbi:MAG: response regulator transcription factor [Candidatus Odinarchaeota archaeon]